MRSLRNNFTTSFEPSPFFVLFCARSSQLWALMRVMYQTDFVRVRFGGPLAWQNVFTIIHATFPFLFVLTLPLADPLQRLLLLHVILSTQGERSFYLFSNILASYRWPRHKEPFILILFDFFL
ncbi:Uncharacterized protein APZ42_011233 [Daphnia magna]|uniref:Uncharacterized protein n=1 Tax=Daphnia magna TaxID=35525 RepID=A0A0P5DGA8_9CRUS|nr:Uncharacterized protein APZ42_011233 [Daphnia magna]